MRFKNFRMWRGRLPHWRADDVVYFVTFRHRRELDPRERDDVFDAIRKPDGKAIELAALAVFAERTEAIFSVPTRADGTTAELAKVIEGAKRKAGKAIVKRSGERFPPFWEESFDRIIRDDTELQERFEAMVALAEESNESTLGPYPWLFLA